MIKQVVTFSDNIQALHAAGGVLWIAHRGGLTAFHAGLGIACKWTTADGLPALPVLDVATSGARVAAATPNGVAWCDDAPHLLETAFGGKGPGRWQHGLADPQGAGAYVNRVAFVDGAIWAATGGGRVYREGRAGFEVLELPVPQARLGRILPLVSPRGERRILILTNNSGVLLLATGRREPAVYQWAEDEGFVSRYATAMTAAGPYITVAVHGAVHVAPAHRLVEHPEDVSRWGTVRIPHYGAAAEQNRIPALCAHGDSLYLGASTGLFRVPLVELDRAAREPLVAEALDAGPVRHLASTGDTLWIAQSAALGRWVDAAAAPRPRAPVVLGVHSPAFPAGRGAAPRSRPEWADPAPGSLSNILPEVRWRLASEIETHGVFALAASPDAIAVGGESGRVAFRRNGIWHTEAVARLRRMPEVHGLAWDSENGLFWAATRHGLYQHEARGRWRRDPGFPGRSVHALAPWRGTVVALSNAGVHVHVQGEWSPVAFAAGPVPALFVACASDHALALAGRVQSGVWIWRRDGAGPEPVAIPAGRANCMAWGEGGDLWFGTDRGLARWDGAAVTSFVWNDERRDHITAVTEHAGRLYVGSQAGLWTVPVRNLHSATGPALESLGERIGLLQGLPDANVTKLLVHESAVWAGTQGGLALL